MPCIFVTVLTKKTFISECAINSTTAMACSTFTPCLFSLQCAMSIKEKLEPPLNGERIRVFFPASDVGRIGCLHRKEVEALAYTMNK